MALTKAHNRMIQGSSFHVDDYGAVGDGVTDDTAAIQAAFDAASAISSGLQRTLVTFRSGANYVISSEVSSLNVSIEGNGANIRPNGAFPAMTFVGNNQWFANLFITYETTQTDPAAIGLKLWVTGSSNSQTSKNTITNVQVRNAYRGFQNIGGLAATGSIFGTVFTNCRSNFCHDWAWFFDGSDGTTTLTFINCQANGVLGNANSKGFYLDGSTEYVLINCAADKCTDKALEVRNSRSVWVDTFALESNLVQTPNAALIDFSGNAVVRVGNVKGAVTTFDVGAGNVGYYVRVSSGQLAQISNIERVFETLTSGTSRKLRTNNSTRVKTDFVPLSDVETLGNQELFFDAARFKGLAIADPTGTWTRTYEVGDIAWNLLPTAGGVEPIGWVCVAAGTPGTWAAFGTIA